MKFRRLFKKAAAALMAAVTALSVLPATTAFAAGDIGTISFTHTYDSNGNAMTIQFQCCHSTDIPQAVREITSTVCMWTAMWRFVFSRVYR